MKSIHSSYYLFNNPLHLPTCKEAHRLGVPLNILRGILVIHFPSYCYRLQIISGHLNLECAHCIHNQVERTSQFLKCLREHTPFLNYYFTLLYSSSDTGSNHSGVPAVIAMCSNQLSFAAPCQCFTPS